MPTEPFQLGSHIYGCGFDVEDEYRPRFKKVNIHRKFVYLGIIGVNYMDGPKRLRDEFSIFGWRAPSATQILAGLFKVANHSYAKLESNPVRGFCGLRWWDGFRFGAT
jgi:hypothetical protein